MAVLRNTTLCFWAAVCRNTTLCFWRGGETQPCVSGVVFGRFPRKKSRFLETQRCVLGGVFWGVCFWGGGETQHCVLGGVFLRNITLCFWAAVV